MPRFHPFAALRYSTGPDLGRLACPPYDVIDDEDRAELISTDKHNAVRIELPRAGDRGADPYAGAAQLIADWTAAGTLARDPEPRFYAYRMTPPEGPPTFGYLGALGVTDADGLLPHEQTTPKAKSDRLDLLRATRVNASPIWCLSLAEGLASLWRPEGPAEAHATDPEGVLHEMWVVPPEAAAAISDKVGGSPVAVADGHHRWETARNYLHERTGDQAAEFILAYVVELSPDELQVRPIHRLLTGLDDPVNALAPWFEASEPAEITLVTAEGDVGLAAHSSTRQAAEHDADAERLQVALDGLDSVEVTYLHDEHDVRRWAKDGQGVGVLLRPVGIDVIAAAARAGERFPPKTTFFWPKPMTGFVFRQLDG